jgi:hypothetical protein
MVLRKAVGIESVQVMGCEMHGDENRYGNGTFNFASKMHRAMQKKKKKKKKKG